jgi:hypothetical protein
MRKIGLLTGVLLSVVILCPDAYSADPAGRQRPAGQQQAPGVQKQQVKPVQAVIPAPSNLVASVDSENRLSTRWTWTSPATIAGFTIERKEGTGGFVQVTEVGPSVRALVEAGFSPKPDTQYTYRVKACAAIDGKEACSPYSNEASVTTRETAPGEPKKVIESESGFVHPADKVGFNPQPEPPGAPRELNPQRLMK